jgi:hypothetical protein
MNEIANPLHGVTTRCWQCDREYGISNKGAVRHQDKNGNWRLFCSMECVKKAREEGKLLTESFEKEKSPEEKLKEFRGEWQK